MTYSAQDKINNHRIYSLFLQMGMDDGWSKDDKWENFQMFMGISALTRTPIEGCSILDVGCGTGDFVQFLSDKGVHEYSGLDIFEPAIEKAKQRFPQYTFTTGDFLQMKFQKKFDFVFCSGALTTKLDTNNYQLLPSWIQKMWDTAKKGVVFNFLIGDNASTNILFLYNPEEVLQICKKYIPQARVKTIITNVRSEDTIEEMHVFLF